MTPTRELTGVMVRARVAKPPQARRSPFEPAAGEEKFLGQKALFIGKSLTKLSGAAEARQADRHRPSTAQSSSRPSPTGYLVLMLEPQLLVACQQHCCRALFLHDGPRAARTTMRNALAVSRTLLAVFAPRVLRVSAAARRGAAAYADGDQRMVRARTHQSGLVRPPQSEIRWAFLHNFLRTCRWHRVSRDSHTSISSYTAFRGRWKGGGVAALDAAYAVIFLRGQLCHKKESSVRRKRGPW